jgi:hypothetical protein
MLPIIAGGGGWAADWAQEFSGQTQGGVATSGDVGAASWSNEFAGIGNEWESEFKQFMANGDSLDHDPQVTLLSLSGDPYGDEKIANRDIRVWHGATENGP